MEQRTPPEGHVEREGQRQGSKEVRLASHRECGLLANVLNDKYGHAVSGRKIPHNLAVWSRDQLEKSLK